KHLLRISLLLLLLLPLASSCSSQRPLAELGEDYMGIVQTHLNNAVSKNTLLLYTCVLQDFVGVLHNLTCQMGNIKLNHTQQLAVSVLNSIECTCSLKLSEEPKVRPKRRRTAMIKNHKQQRKLNRGTKRLCKVKAILSSMSECYEMLNSLLGNT
uniref:Interleukin-7 n=1 Tax=Hippocampus comes TaxID=109280 RepID=A0A3Q2Z3B4_HIPCM